MTKRTFSGVGSSLPDAPSAEELARFELNDYGNAMRLIRLVGGDVGDEGVDHTNAQLLYLREIGWIGWNGKIWDLKLGQRLAEKTAHKVAQGLYQQAPFIISSGAVAKEVYKFVRETGNAGKASSMLRSAETYLQVDLEEFDNDPLKLTVQNGTLTFRRQPGEGMTVDFAGHDPRDRITRLADAIYDRQAAAPLWRASLESWLPDDEVRAFIKRAIGYTFTGYTHEQVFFILQGKGRDGKSTFVGALRELAGGYADVADVRTFLDIGQRGGADASPDLARLAGDCRLVSVSEPPRGAKLAESMIKSFTGGAPILARRLRQDLFSFLPKPKVVMECNSRPVIRGDDEGIWRRIRLVLFENQVPREQVDRELPSKLTAERSGILNWVIEGVGDWLAEGLREPERISEAMEDYRKGSSPFGEWFADCVDVDAEAVTPASHFYSSYKEWCERQGIEKPMTQRSFGEALADRQIIRCGKSARGGNVLRKGARLRSGHEGGAAPAASAQAGDPGPQGPSAYGHLGGDWPGIGDGQ